MNCCVIYIGTPHIYISCLVWPRSSHSETCHKSERPTSNLGIVAFANHWTCNYTYTYGTSISLLERLHKKRTRSFGASKKSRKRETLIARGVWVHHVGFGASDDQFKSLDLYFTDMMATTLMHMPSGTSNESTIDGEKFAWSEAQLCNDIGWL